MEAYDARHECKYCRRTDCGERCLSATEKFERDKYDALPWKIIGWIALGAGLLLWWYINTTTPKFGGGWPG